MADRGSHSKDLDEFGQIGNDRSSNSEAEKLRPEPGSQQQLGERCPLCGTPVEVVSGDEGTSHYEPTRERPA